MENEKHIKRASNQSRLADIRAKLKKALIEVKAAQKLASKTAACCEVSLDSLIDEIEGQIGNANDHIKDGILEGDIIINGKAGQI